MQAPQELRLSPEESARFREVADKVDSYADGVRAMAEYVKRKSLDQILADRQSAPQPNPTKE